MTDDLTELLKSLKAAKEILNQGREDDTPATTKERLVVLPPKPDQQGERKVSLGDAAKRHKDYEREPLDKK